MLSTNRGILDRLCFFSQRAMYAQKELLTTHCKSGNTCEISPDITNLPTETLKKLVESYCIFPVFNEISVIL